MHEPSNNIHQSFGAPLLESQFAVLPLLAGVPAGTKQELLAAARLSTHDKGDIFLSAGDTAARFYILTEGWACFRKSNADGRESILHIIQKHEFFPDLGNVKVSVFDVVALTACRAISFPLERIRALAADCASLSANVRADMERRTQDLLDHVEHLTLHDAEHRVGWFLLRLKLSNVGAKSVIDLPFEKTVIASYLGIKPETLSRVLAHFRDQGVVSQRDHMVLPHTHALCAYCDARTAQDCEHGGTAHCFYPPSDRIEPA